MSPHARAHTQNKNHIIRRHIADKFVSKHTPGCQSCDAFAARSSSDKMNRAFTCQRCGALIDGHLADVVTVTSCPKTWLNGIHRTCAETAAVSRSTSHARTKERYQYTTFMDINSTSYKRIQSLIQNHIIVQELCESRGSRPGLSVLTSLLVSVDVKL